MMSVSAPNPTLRTCPFGSTGLAVPVSLFLIGLSATIYVGLGEFAGMGIRPVQFVPLTIGVVVLPFLPVPRIRRGGYLLGISFLWAVYMFLRHAMLGEEGFGFGMRAVVCVITYFTVVALACHAGGGASLLAGLAAGCVLSVTCILHNVTVGDMTPLSHSGRWEGLMPGANTMGNISAIVLLVSVALWLSRCAPPWRQTALLGVVVGAMGLMGSGSRGALFAAILSGMVLLATTNLARGKAAFSFRTVVAVSATVLVASALLYCFRASIPDRLTALVESPDKAVEKIASDPRFILFQQASQYFLASPIIGSGSEVDLYLAGTDKEFCAHNTYLDILATSGFVGFALFVLAPILMGIQLVKSVRPQSGIPESLRRTAACALALLVFVCAHNFVIVMRDSIHVWLVFAIAAHACIETTNFRVPRESGEQVRPTARRGPSRPVRSLQSGRVFVCDRE